MQAVDNFPSKGLGPKPNREGMYIRDRNREYSLAEPAVVEPIEGYSPPPPSAPRPVVRKSTKSSNVHKLHGKVLRLQYEIACWPEPAYILCARAGFAQPLLSLYLRSGKPIPTHHLHALAQVLGKNPSDLLGYIELP